MNLKSTNWYIWRKSYEDERPSIYTDVTSLIGRDKRLIAMICVIIAIQLPFIIRILLHTPFRAIGGFNMALITMIIAFEAFGVVQLYRHIRKLEENKLNE